MLAKPVQLPFEQRNGLGHTHNDLIRRLPGRIEGPQKRRCRCQPIIFAIGLGASQSHKGIAAAFHRRIARRGALLQRQCQCALLIIQHQCGGGFGGLRSRQPTLCQRIEQIQIRVVPSL